MNDQVLKELGYDVENKHLKLTKSVRSKLEKLGYVIRECDMGSNFTLMHIRKNGVELTEIDIPASYNYNGNVYKIVAIDRNAFNHCSSLKSVTISDGIKLIGDYAFSNCPSLSNVIIPDSVIKIGMDIFNDCTALKSVKVPDNVEEVSYWAFSELQNIEYHGNLEDAPWGADALNGVKV